MINNINSTDSPEPNDDSDGTISGCQPGDFFNFLGLLLQGILAALAFSLLMG